MFMSWLERPHITVYFLCSGSMLLFATLQATPSWKPKSRQQQYEIVIGGDVSFLVADITWRRRQNSVLSQFVSSDSLYFDSCCLWVPQFYWDDNCLLSQWQNIADLPFRAQSLPWPGFEPGFSRATTRSTNHYTIMAKLSAGTIGNFWKADYLSKQKIKC